MHGTVTDSRRAVALPESHLHYSPDSDFRRSEMMSCTTWRLTGALLLAAALTACGDAPTSDHRGYTKAPLETIGLFIQPEVRTGVSRFARLNLPDGQPIVLQDSVPGGG